ncbi:MAG: sugar ABC transporter permease [Lachnospiraceae bacterium]|nr:sugar ABC transporter permease [Lachnospiraceae bacterium]
MKKGKYMSMGRLERKRLPWIYLFVLPSIAIFLLFYLWPIVSAIATSFTKWNGFTTPEFNGINNYLRLFRQESFWLSIRNLLGWSALAATVHVGFSLLVALIFFRRPPGWKFARAAFMVPNVISGAAWAMIYRFVFNNEFGLLNGLIRKGAPNFDVNWFYESPAAFWAITFTWIFYAVVGTLVILADLMAVPADVREAARIDGASGWQLTRFIDLPLCRFSIGTTMIMSLTARITMYECIALTTRGGPGDDTMGLALLLVKNITDYNYGVANAIGVIMLLLGGLILFVVRKSFRMGESID